MLSALSWKGVHADIRHRIPTSCGPRSCSMRPTGWATTRSPHAWTPRDRWYPSGANASTSSACPDLPISPGEDDPPVFPPDVVVAVKALACELPTTADAPLARWHCPDLARAAVEHGIVAAISGTTIWRWLCADAIKPWQHRSWIFPRDPDFATTPSAPSQPTRVEAEYFRGGSLAYLAAWDVHRAKVFGRCEQTTGIDPFDRLVGQVMTTEPYATARRVFWV